MADVRVLVLRTAGINCDEEVLHCWSAAGAVPTLIHLNELAGRATKLDEFQIVTIPGGFSYGDDLGAGTIFAARIKLDLADALGHFVERGGGLLGICNGFQVLVKAGLLPGAMPGRGGVTITHNDSARFEARWVGLSVCTDRCAFLRAGEMLQMPVEHAQGKVVVARDDMIAAWEQAGQVALRYCDNRGRSDEYPANPNGSISGIAGLCDSTGRVLGLMPHPDRCFDRLQHPCWTSRASEATADGMAVFTRAVAYWS